METGSGNLPANALACHMDAETEVGRVLDMIPRSWHTGIPDFVLPNRPILGVPVGSGYFGIATLGGTNWIVALAEQKIRIPNPAMKRLAEI